MTSTPRRIMKDPNIQIKEHTNLHLDELLDQEYVQLINKVRKLQQDGYSLVNKFQDEHNATNVLVFEKYLMLGEMDFVPTTEKVIIPFNTIDGTITYWLTLKMTTDENYTPLCYE